MRFYSDIKMTSMTTKVQKSRGNTANLKRAGMGRPKGVPNKATKALKEMILGALDQAGGEQYLLEQAQANPVAFMTLIGKVLPSEIQAQLSGALSVYVNTGIDRARVE